MEQTCKDRCLDELKVYYGIEPYIYHISAGSGQYYWWLKTKYSENMIKECEEELNVRRNQ
jgi:hypothetical protein